MKLHAPDCKAAKPSPDRKVDDGNRNDQDKCDDWTR